MAGGDRLAAVGIGVAPSWTAHDLGWAILQPIWAPARPPVVISLDEVAIYGFAAISDPLPTGRWLVRLRLGPTCGAMRLATADRDGENRQPRSDTFAAGQHGCVVARIEAGPGDVCLVIQKRDNGPGSVAILGVDLAPDDGAVFTPPPPAS